MPRVGPATQKATSHLRFPACDPTHDPDAASFRRRFALRCRYLRCSAWTHLDSTPECFYLTRRRTETPLVFSTAALPASPVPQSKSPPHALPASAIVSLCRVSP